MKRFMPWFLQPAVIGTLAMLVLSAMVWWLGPLVSVGRFTPLGSTWLRVLLLVALWSIWLGRLAWLMWRRRRTNAALLAGMSAGSSASEKQAQLLTQRFHDAMETLKAHGKRSWLGSGQYVYELPWYIFVGAPGSGKTTALKNAGLQFLLGDATKAEVAGVGGTRHCEWWFTQDAVLLDTAGRYATQESDHEVDAGAWEKFLELLRKTRPRQPINGILLTVNVQDLLQQGEAERRGLAAKLRARLQELQTKLGVRAPVYVLVTKADLINGFSESFEALGKEERDQVWGFTLTKDIGPGDDPLQDFSTLYQQLQARLVEQLVARLEAERDVLRRAAIFSFPAEFAALQPVLGDFLRWIVSGGGSLEMTPRLRGVYFTSGTQEGTPIDRVMGTLSRSFGIDTRALTHPAGRGKSFFLHRLLRDVVFMERGLGAISVAADRRWHVLRLLSLVGIAALSITLLVGWVISRSRNLDHAELVRARVPTLQAAVSALPPPTTADVSALPETLAQVRDAAKSDAFDLAEPPLLNGLGLYQGEKLDAAAQLAYTRLLEKTFMPRIARRLEERLRAVSRDNLENAYESLKAYQMLYQPEQFDAQALRALISLDWDSTLTRLTPEQRHLLDEHLDAMLALGSPHASLPKDEALIASVRDMLAAFPLEYRIYSRIKRQYHPGEQPDFTLAAAAGPNAVQVFVRASTDPLTKGISGLYTRQGYEKFFKPAVQKTALQLAREESWVLGVNRDSARLKNMVTGTELSDKVRRLYFEDYIKTWDTFLNDVRLVKLDGLERSISVAKILSAVDSPLAAYLRGVTAETRLAVPPSSAGVLDQAAQQAKAEAARLAGDGAPAGGSGGPLERMVDDHFSAIHRQVSGQPAPIDETLKMFNELYMQLSAVDAAQKSKSPPPSGGGAEQIKAAAGRLPEPVRGMLEQLAGAGASQSRNAEIRSLSSELKPISDFCQRAISGRYPFASGARADVLPDDFGEFFGVGGLMDDFFQRRLGDLVDTSTATWRYKPLSDGSKPVAAAALAEFQRAARIREVFFRAGGKQPAIKIEMSLAGIDPTLKELVLNTDGQEQILQPNSPSITVNWPSQRVATQIRLSTRPGDASVSFEGPWALFRLFDRFELQPSGAPEKFGLVINMNGKNTKVDVLSRSVFNPFQMKEIKQFRCPTAL